MIRALVLLAALSFTAVLGAQPADLVVTIDAGAYDAQQRADVTVEVKANVPLADPEQIELDVHTFDGISLASWSTGTNITCTEIISTFLRCQVAPLAAGETALVTMRVHTNFGPATTNVTAELRWWDRGYRPEYRSWRKDLYRYLEELVVTNADDAGPGSLRQAIVDANASCEEFRRPCLIRFDLGEQATIFARTPLPAITGRDVVIEGPVTIDGSLLDRPANGLTFSEHGTGVLRDLTIQRFPENGAEITTTHFVRVESCLITGNRSRGVTVLGNAAVDIDDSILSGNGRSGVFVVGGHLSLVRSRVESNGASGVFVGRAYNASITDNVIAGNAHFGIATVAENHDVDVGRNRIVGNRLRPIDIGLDGPSRFPEPRPGEFLPPNGPTLHWAAYDPATGVTTVAGRLDDAPFRFPYLTYELHFYATTAANDADQYLGGIHITHPAFAFTVRGDLRGRLVTANTIYWLNFPAELTNRTTSQLSTPIEVR